MRLPPRWLRRLVIWPLPFVLAWFYLVSVPLLLVVAAVMSWRLPGKLRALRAFGLASVYLFVEVVVGIWALLLWIASGFGTRLGRARWQDAHYRLLRWAVDTLVRAGCRLFVLEVDVAGTVRTPDGPVDVEEYDSPDPRPLVVMSRHAGPADSILLMHQITSHFERRPRIVLKAALQWAPSFDILLNRLPNRFVGGTHGTTVDAVRDLASGMEPGDAFVIFPEGGNFTEHRRQRAIEWFERHGRRAEAARARRLHRVLPPRPGGALAALHGAHRPAAVFVAHTGLDEITGLGDLWSAIPDNKVLDMVFSAVLPEAVPAHPDDQVEMLWREWEAIDEWIVTRSRDG